MTATTDVPTPPAASLPPLPPPVHHQPLRIADDVFLIRQLEGEGTDPFCVYLNSVVIAGREPVIVDTGSLANREHWLDDVFGIVKPSDVRWVYISHDDVDHLGNLDVVLERCPNATLVVNWLTVQRLRCETRLPLTRMRWVNDGDHLQLADRMLVALRPPTYDSPTTRGLFDTKSRVYWSSDSFGAMVPHHVDSASELPPEAFSGGQAMFNRILSPWTALVDRTRFADRVAAIRALDASCIASCHAPAMRTKQAIELACSTLEQLPAMDPAPLPGQEQLEAMISAMTHGPGS